MPSIRVGEIELSYRDEGDGPPVVLLHGFPFSSRLWAPQIEGLRSGHRVIAPDLRGFGRSPVVPGPYRMETLADDVAGLMDALGLARAAVAGLSMGGYVAFELYRRHPGRVARLMLADTRAEPDDEEGRARRARMAERARAEGTGAIVDGMIPKLVAPATLEERPEIVRELRAIMEEVDPEAVAAALEGMAERADSRPLLAEISVPVLVIVGAEDAITPPAVARAMVEAIPDARLEVVASAGHVSNLERPEAFNAAILDVLED